MSSSPRARAALTIPTLVLLVASTLARAADVESTIAGRVLDATSGNPVKGAWVVAPGPPPTAGSPPVKETGVTGADGSWELTGVPAGSYKVLIEKSGFKPAKIEHFVVRPGESPRADLNLNALSADAPEIPSDVEEFVVVGTKAETIEASRESSDQLLTTLSAEEFSKFAASDVADALKFVPGVNVVKGQFAIIRGLEDRYSSTLYNGAPIPSPDPDRQSVPLDLFPSEVVTNLVVAKTFAPELPSNSSGGSINIITHDYPEDVEVKFTGGASINSNADNEFLKYDAGSSVGIEKNSARDVLGSEFGMSIAGRGSPMEREVRYKLVLNQEIKYNTATGLQEGREPVQRDPGLMQSGGLAHGELALSDGQFDLTDSDKEKQILGYGGFGFDIDQQGNHKLDISAFYTKKDDRAVELKDNGYFPGFDYGVLAQKQTNEADIDRNGDSTGFATPGAWIARTVRGNPGEPPSRGPIWFSSFSNSTSFKNDRDLLVTQLNGDHTIEAIEGLHVSWGANYAKTTQQQLSQGTRLFFEPDDPNVIPARTPTPAELLGPGQFAAPKAGIQYSSADVNEHQYFGRLDGDYTMDLVDSVVLRFTLGGWYENAQRDVSASYLQDAGIDIGRCPPEVCVGTSSQFAIMGDTPNEVGHNTFDELLRGPDGVYASLRDTSNNSTREVTAGNLGVKATVFEQVDLLGGMRLEHLR